MNNAVSLVNASIWIRTISINNAPPVLPVNSPRDSWVQMCETLKNKSEFRETVGSLMVARFEAQEVEVKPVEEQIYGGFYSRNDQNILQDFQAVDWPKRAELILQFDDQRLKQLGRRLVSFYASETGDQSDTERFSQFLREKWYLRDGKKVPWTTFDEVKRQLEEIDQDPKIEKGIKEYLKAYYQKKQREVI